MRHVGWILLRDISSVALRGLEENLASLLLVYHSLFAPKVKVNEAEEKYKAIQDKLITVSEEAQALHPQCISLKADVQARRKAVNEAEVGKKNFQRSYQFKALILSVLYPYVSPSVSRLPESIVQFKVGAISCLTCKWFQFGGHGIYVFAWVLSLGRNKCNSSQLGYSFFTFLKFKLCLSVLMQFSVYLLKTVVL